MTDDQINAAIALLRSKGYSVTLPRADEWVTPVDLWRSHGAGCSLAQFRDRLHHSRCPQFQRHVGASGRMTTLRPTPQLLEFLTKPSQPGKRLQ